MSDALIDAQEREIERLKVENDRLRELCADMYIECGRGMGDLLFSCSECTHSIRDVRTCDNNGCLNYKTYQKMLELGIEVE